VDFCAPGEMLIIELDGSQHIDQSESDVKWTEYLVSRGYQVIRFWNNDVLNDLNGVYRSIEQELQKWTSKPPPRHLLVTSLVLLLGTEVHCSRAECILKN
jgi:very-short-patch-repair endonuclease